jgi:hypothetical protein
VSLHKIRLSANLSAILLCNHRHHFTFEGCSSYKHLKVQFLSSMKSHCVTITVIFRKITAVYSHNNNNNNNNNNNSNNNTKPINAKIELSLKRVLKYIARLVKSTKDPRVCLLYYISNVKACYEQFIFQNFE